MSSKYLIQQKNPFIGKHCQSSALKKILDFHDINLSEEMLLGLGDGVGFIYWYQKQMDFPFVGGRGSKVDDFLLKICKRIGVKATILNTSSNKKAYSELISILSSGEPALIFCDMAYLTYSYIPENAHFGGHNIVVYGIDEDKNEAIVSDRSLNCYSLGIDNLKKAMESKYPPFPAKNKIVKFDFPSKISNFERGIIESIKDCCNGMLKPAIKNFGLEGIKKWSQKVIEWEKEFTGMDIYGCLCNIFIYIEIGGTGGSAFRLMYSNFLKEAGIILNNKGLLEMSEMFLESAKLWQSIANTALSDNYDSLKKLKALFYKKNQMFENNNVSTSEDIISISNEIDSMADLFKLELNKKPIKSTLIELHEQIKKLYEFESNIYPSLLKVVQ